MIKRILALRYVCKKYNLKYCYSFFGNVGWIGYVEESGSEKYDLISVSLFSRHFWSILFHEVGHLVAKRTLQYQERHCNALGINYEWGVKELYILIAEEATASKFSNRMTKGVDKKYLKGCWHTYTGYAAKVNKSHNLNKYVSYVHYYNKYFE